MTYMIVSKLIIQTLYTALFQFKCCDSSIDLDEISLPSSTVIEGLLQEHPSLLSLSDVQEAVSVSKSTQECLKPEPEPVFQVTEKVVKTGPRKGNTEQMVQFSSPAMAARMLASIYQQLLASQMKEELTSTS